MKKRGQMKLSFGMIFSIILIIIFLSVAFYAITKFLSFQKELGYRQFSEDLQSDVDKIWKSSQGTQSVTYSLPSDAEEVCFLNNEDSNLLIDRKKGLFSDDIGNINIIKILKGETRFCVIPEDNKVEFILSKNFNESLVTISNA